FLTTSGTVAGVLATDPGRDHGQGLGADVFAELEELKKAESVGLVITPGIAFGFAGFERADRLFPIVEMADAGTVHQTAAGETHELRLEVGNGFGEVTAQAVGAAFERVVRH